MSCLPQLSFSLSLLPSLPGPASWAHIHILEQQAGGEQISMVGLVDGLNIWGAPLNSSGKGAGVRASI